MLCTVLYTVLYCVYLETGWPMSKSRSWSKGFWLSRRAAADGFVALGVEAGEAGGWAEDGDEEEGCGGGTKPLVARLRLCLWESRVRLFGGDGG